MDEIPNDPPAIAAAVVVHDGKVLLVRRRVAEGDLSWQLPAGAIETGESPESAAARETAEETGVTVQPLLRVGERIHPLSHRRMFYIACQVVSGLAHVADRDELQTVEWVEIGDVSTYIPGSLFEPVQTYLQHRLV